VVPRVSEEERSRFLRYLKWANCSKVNRFKLQTDSHGGDWLLNYADISELAASTCRHHFWDTAKARATRTPQMLRPRRLKRRKEQGGNMSQK
jgi:hypothetical protein